MEHFNLGAKLKFSHNGLNLYSDKFTTQEEMLKWRFEVRGFTKTSLVLKRLDIDTHGNIEDNWSPMYFEVVNGE